MIERIGSLAINGNVVEDYNIESSLLELKDKVNEMIDAVNDLVRREQARNRQTHKGVVKVGEGELAYCEDCHGGEVDLWEHSCDEFKALGDPSV